MEAISGPCPHVREAAVSGRRLGRAVRAVYAVVVKKQQPKLVALGGHLHRLLSSARRRHRPAALTCLSSSLSCRSMDPAAAVVHPLPRDHRSWSGPRAGAATALSSLSCRSMDAAAAVHQYRPREVQFSCKSTPPHRRRRAPRRADQHRALEPECRGSAAAVSRLFEVMDADEEAGKKDLDLDDGDVVDLEEAAGAWPAPRQVRITDSPFPARQEEEDERMVDRRADEFITWFHEQLRTQHKCAVREELGASYYWVR